MKHFGEKGEWVHPGTAQFFGVPPIISGAGKATYFKFATGQYIQRVHPHKSPLKILEKRECGRIQGLPNVFGYPLLSQEREKLQISNLASTFRGSIRTKAHEKFLENREHGRSQGLPNFFGYPLLSQERGKLQISNFACTFMGSIGTKAH